MNAAPWPQGLAVNDRWRALLLAEGPRIATWVLGLALGVQSALIVTDVARTARGGAVPAQPAAARGGGAMQRAHALDVNAITAAHLFGAPPPPKQDAANAPETNIPLVLTGTIAGNDPQNGLAILGQTAQNAKVFAVGDNVPGGARLHSVYADRVVLDRNGQLETLALPRKSSAIAPPPSTAALQTREPLERMRHLVTEQPALIYEILRPQPVFDHGKVTGFRIFPGRNARAFLRLGLRPGDQVTAINGTPLDDRERGEQILQSLSNSSEARITVIRGGQQQDLALNLAQVAQEAQLAAQQGRPAGLPGPAPGAPPPGPAAEVSPEAAASAGFVNAAPPPPAAPASLPGTAVPAVTLPAAPPAAAEVPGE